MNTATVASKSEIRDSFPSQRLNLPTRYTTKNQKYIVTSHPSYASALSRDQESHSSIIRLVHCIVLLAEPRHTHLERDGGFGGVTIALFPDDRLSRVLLKAAVALLSVAKRKEKSADEIGLVTIRCRRKGECRDRNSTLTLAALLGSI